MGISVQIGSSLQAKVSSCWWGVDGNISTNRLPANRFQLTSRGEFLLVGGWMGISVQIGSSLQAKVSSCWWGGGGWEYQYK